MTAAPLSTSVALTSLARGAVADSLAERARAIELARRQATRAVGIGVGVGAGGAVVFMSLAADLPVSIAPIAVLATTIGLSSAMLGLALASCGIEVAARAAFRRVAAARGLSRDEADRLVEAARLDLVTDDHDAGHAAAGVV